ncbi:MAG: hypothetical protein IJ229_03830, partial [Clostridia bacterium]|nr:hypothetical protein [Clostridia bacterium]
MKKLLIGMMTAGMLILALIYASAESYLWPVPSSRNLSRGFYAGHEALDISGGGNIVATKSGKVFYVYSGCNNSNAWGNRSCSSATCSPSTGYWLDKKDSM